jgi:hypothetical protein
VNEPREPKVDLTRSAEENRLIYYDEATEFTKQDMDKLREIHLRRYAGGIVRGMKHSVATDWKLGQH